MRWIPYLFPLTTMQNLGFVPNGEGKASHSIAQIPLGDEDTDHSTSWITHFGCSLKADNKSIRNNGHIMSRSNSATSSSFIFIFKILIGD